MLAHSVSGTADKLVVILENVAIGPSRLAAGPGRSLQLRAGQVLAHELVVASFSNTWVHDGGGGWVRGSAGAGAVLTWKEAGDTEAAEEGHLYFSTYLKKAVSLCESETTET